MSKQFWSSAGWMNFCADFINIPSLKLGQREEEERAEYTRTTHLT